MLDVINSLSDLAFILLYIFVFYISLKKCFLREGKSKILLFILSVVTNPMTLFLVSFVVSFIVERIIRGRQAEIVETLSLTAYVLGGVLFISMIIIFSGLVGRWLKAYNISLMTFLYLMFGVVCALSGESVSETDLNYVISPAVQGILQNAVYIVAVLLIYRFVVGNLSELTDKKRQISWKLFLIPPILFLPVYYVFDYLTYRYDNGFSNTVVRTYSIIVLALFIWAFTVIIRNINASNAVIEARYEAEHDKLTGLYNKGKYMMLKENHFDDPGSIALFNFDVNNLKYINDNFGHEYGDELIIKAAQSIHAVTSDCVFGFRMGGDEYAMVAVNVTKKETDEIYDGWKRALEDLNTQGNVCCVMACGLKYCEGEFDTEELFKQADELMYLDKKARKEKGETSHLREF
ncbi:diguanylate cyclase (GGDEF) domain-containing protein [Lachnospiraceae bacterium XPB1003]|nr:diguanylate cyclase (GGDEF) domain-containing protein [Lachnospiraceae bacterium XPB1003]